MNEVSLVKKKKKIISIRECQLLEIVWQYMGFPGGSDHKESACNPGDPGSIPGLGRSPGEENGNPVQYSCLETPRGQKSLAAYSPWGPKRVGHK